MTATLDNPMDSSPAETFTASRWTQGNFLFPTRLVISPQRVARVKGRLFGSNEESISISKIASVHISTGVFWSEIVTQIWIASVFGALGCNLGSVPAYEIGAWGGRS